ncbi:DNA-binding response regulator [Acidovorax sp. SRB_14]|uniref:response regulator n=1 Tax=unclassified Acidovorax TaxID=2684926 RepID=UPI00145CB060|nr:MULTISPECIES: response regulator transcription factor [unclassified Acidovorax]NMM78665.1 DNA-binding response regulator [Acidovorax sp. SRB_24]NMM79508.1 DNA-binding response regulator [Acidovorax sp. SRB_14]NMM84760.1 DNA-binding response regulator [Rhodococcus sp. SRB_17]
MTFSSKPIRVLLIDDHQTMLWGLVKLIESEKPRMEVAGTARTGEEALEKIGSLHPDVILLDLDLGGKSALDILPALLLNPASQVLIFTGERNQATLDLAVLRGARGILRKDASAEQVLKAIEKTAEGEMWLDRETLSRVFREFTTTKLTKKSNPEAEKQASLTPRERKIIYAVIEGNGAHNKALADRLFISEHTLRNHLTAIYQKLGVSNRLELYVYASKHQLGNLGSSGNPDAQTTP